MQETEAIRVLLAEQREPVRAALRLIITHTGGMQVVGEATQTADLWTAAQPLPPHVLLVDWGMVAAEAETLLPALRGRWPGLRIVALSWRPEVGPVALGAGVDAFVSKIDPPERLLRALHVGAPGADREAGPAPASPIRRAGAGPRDSGGGT